MMGLYFGNRLIAYCFSHRVHIKNADIKYKIMLPKYIEINYKQYDKFIATTDPIDMKKIRRQIAINITHQEIVNAMLDKKAVVEIFKKLKVALVMYQIGDTPIIDLEF